jgi:tight adherence protein B
MDSGLLIVLVVGFLAVVFALEGVYLLWNDSRGPEVQRLQRRMRMVAEGPRSLSPDGSFRKVDQDEGPSLVGRMLSVLPRISWLDRLVEHSGSGLTVSRIVSLALAIFVMVAMALLVVGRSPWPLAVILAAMTASIPFVWLMWKRSKHISALEAQLPDAIDLIARAMRAGHAFPAAIQMVGDESPDPLAAEFRIVHDEINFGLPMEEAFRNLARRVPSDDVRFFTIAVLLQRETGGNLAEVLGNLSKLVRDRFKLLGKVRVLAAEGKLSGWILGIMPIAIGILINLLNPKFMSKLWTDPMGLTLVYACCVLYVIGAAWMYSIIKIRV